MMRVSARGLRLIIRFEGFSVQSYNDEAGHATIGYGHKIKPRECFNTTITPAEAEVLLQQDVTQAEHTVNSLVQVRLSQTQYDALVSFVYNIGCTAFARSTLLKYVNAKNYSSASREFLRWNKLRQKGAWVESAGLTARRATECMLFQEG